MESELHEYAWEWLKYHAGQRLTAFQFFLVFIGFIVTGFSSGIKDGNIAFAQTVAGLGAFISFAFFMLELRNEQLVDIGRNALEYLDKGIDPFKGHPQLHLIKLARKRKGLSRFANHKVCLRTIYVICTLAFMAGVVVPAVITISP
jgi:hypothetical protein